jgi:sugar/nucleoside kinase (ribokinase family)
MSVVPIGRVGDDEAGARLLAEMAEAELDLRYVSALPGTSTLYSFCFLYPDGSGGNLTTENSASGAVSAAVVASAEEQLSRAGAKGIALTVPEVPLKARVKLLEMATRHGSYRVAAFAGGEMETVRRDGVLDHVDLLALNGDEARRLAGVDEEVEDPGAVAETAVHRLSRSHPEMLVSVTAGAAGSWFWDGRSLGFLPAIEVPVSTTGGAGDAHLAGIIGALSLGLRPASAHQLGVLLAAAAVTSPHTIHKAVNRRALAGLAARSGSEDEALLGILDQGALT